MNRHKVTATFMRPARHMQGMLYAPERKGDRSHIGIILMHSDNDYLDQSAGFEMSARGYQVLCANPSMSAQSFNNKIKEVSAAVELLKKQDGIEKVMLIGHSGGASLMSAYQNLAENGAKTFQGSEKIIKCPDFLDGMPPSDGFLCLDSNWGNGAMRLFGVDPAVIDDDDGLNIDESLNLFNPANGFSPEGATYTDEFLEKYFREQHLRNMRLIDYALERLAFIEAGKGRYNDDEPMIVAGASHFGPNNKLFPQDIRFLCRTKQERTLLRPGESTCEIVRTVRKPRNLRSLTGDFALGAMQTTVRRFLDTHAVRTLDGYHYDDCQVFGVDWTSSYNCTPGNVIGISVPTLILSMNGSYEFTAAETIYNNCTSADKTLAFVHGAGHNFYPEADCESYPGEFGDTVKIIFDYADLWLAERFL
ncbi:MAG: alpha/beta hydrolase [Lachnospiraceae bacterium]|jgi:pimeloyl-ACP methyl ester carboxylesterase